MTDLQCCASFWGGCQFLLQGILPTQEWNLCILSLLIVRRILFASEPPGKPVLVPAVQQGESLLCVHTPSLSHVGHCGALGRVPCAMHLFSFSHYHDWLFFVPMDCSPPGSSVHGISQARILEWVAISFSRGSSGIRDWTCVSCIGRLTFYLWATGEARTIQ